jgi:ribonuclease-3
VLQLIFTEYLFDTYADLPEGQLTKLRARLVSREGLKLSAEALDLGRYLMMGRGEESTGGRSRSSALADAYEALIGALYLDSDYVTVRRIVLTEAREHLESLDLEDPGANPKGRLQEILQAITPQSPSYEIVAQSGPEHSKHFISRIVWAGRELGRGEGRSKKEAEVQAARKALECRSWEQSEDQSVG